MMGRIEFSSKYNFPVGVPGLPLCAQDMNAMNDEFDGTEGQKGQILYLEAQSL